MGSQVRKLCPRAISERFPFVVGSCEHDQSARIRVGQRSKKDLIDDAENGRICADAEGEREENGHSERGTFARLASGVTESSTNLFHPAERMEIAHLIFG